MVVNIVGLGKVSLSIARQIKNSVDFGYLVSRNIEKAKVIARELGGTPVSYNDGFLLNGVVLFGLNDSVLIKAQEFVSSKVKDIVAIHFSGFHSSNIFPKDWDPVSMHPNCAVADEFTKFNDIIFGLEGTEKGLAVANEIVEILGGKSVVISTEKKALYHLAAVISSNFPVALAYLSSILYSELGINDELSRKIISKLLESVSENLTKHEIPNALTGPVKRGDWNVVNMERKLFEEFLVIKHICSECVYEELVKILSLLAKKEK